MKERLLKYGITAAVGLAAALIIMAAKGVFTQGDAVKVMHILSDAFFVPGVIIACFGALVLVSNGGAFDIFAYGAHIFFSLFKRDVTARKYRTFYDYRQSRAEKKRSVAFILVVGLAMVAVAAVFLIVYYAMQQPA